MNQSSDTTYRILAVDDEPGVLALIRDTLTITEHAPAALEAAITGDNAPVLDSPAFDLTTCERGDDAVARVRLALDDHCPFAVALVDLRLEDGPTGIDTAAAIRELDPDVEIVMITGHRGTTLAELNQRIPPSGKLLYLEKPFRPQELRQLAISLCSKWQSETMLQELNQSLARTVEERIEKNRTLEAQLQQSQKMEALGTLAGGIAHDFNNILGVVLGYAEIIHDTAGDDEGLRRRIAEILTAGGRARDLINQILNFSRQSPQEMHPLHLAPLIKEGLKLLRSTVPDNIDVSTSITASSDQVAADPTQVHQIILNLCTNALQAMRQTGGSLRVTLEDVPEETVMPQELDGPDWFVRLTVADTGPGMDREVAARVFEPFFTTKKPGEGTGMGLSVVHGIVKNHGGAIKVNSAPGQGTTFHVYLPRMDSVAAPQPTIAPQLTPQQGRVLFVDDELPLTEIGREILEGFGFEVVVRTSSVEALEAFKFKPDAFDLVITDHFMPNMNGLDMAREMLSIRPGLPIILCTGFSDAFSQQRIQALGIGAVIKKPILKSKLIGAVAQLLEPGEDGQAS